MVILVNTCTPVTIETGRKWSVPSCIMIISWIPTSPVGGYVGNLKQIHCCKTGELLMKNIAYYGNGNLSTSVSIYIFLS